MKQIARVIVEAEGLTEPLLKALVSDGLKFFHPELCAGKAMRWSVKGFKRSRAKARK